MELRRIMIIVECSVEILWRKIRERGFRYLNFMFVAIPLTNPQSAIDSLQVFHDITRKGSVVGLLSSKLQCISIFRE